MQPSKERESSDDDPMDDLDDLLDDDLAGGEGESGADAGGAATAEPSPENAGSTGDSGKVGVSGRWFSAKAFGLALVTVAVGVFVGGLIPLIGGTIGTAGGVFLAAFLLGLVLSTRRYAETGIAGGAAGALILISSIPEIAYLTAGIEFLQQLGGPLLAVGGGAGVGLVLALLGHYFGRDLRAGLSQEIEG